MATTRLSSSSPPSPFLKTKITAPSATSTSISFASLPLRPSIHFQHPKHPRETLLLSPHPPHCSMNKARGVTILAVFGRESVFTEEINSQENLNQEDGFSGLKKETRPCELYVCNLPRSHDITDLMDMFKPFGPVLSVEISRNPETGVSRGSGYVTMGSITAARKAISTLDGSDVGGREMRVRFSVDISSGRRNPDTLNSGPTKFLIYESPHKLYVGNIAWTIKPEVLRNHFSRFGTVVSARVLYDRKAGKNRAYGFLSFSTEAERNAALSLDGTDFAGRVVVVRKGVEKSEL